MCIYIHICCRKRIWSLSGLFFAKNASRCRTKHFKREIPVQHDPCKLSVFWGPNSPRSGAKFSPLVFSRNTHHLSFARTLRNPLFFRLFGLFQDSLEISQNACQKECYYIVSFLRGAFLCRDQIPFFAKFTVLPFGMLKATEAIETPYFLVFCVFAGIAFFWPRRNPHIYVLPHFLVFQFLGPKEREQIAKHGG